MTHRFALHRAWSNDINTGPEVIPKCAHPMAVHGHASQDGVVEHTGAVELQHTQDRVGVAHVHLCDRLVER